MGGAYQWPGLSEVMEYRKSVRQLVTDLITSAPLSLPVTPEHPWVREIVPVESICMCISVPT